MLNLPIFYRDFLLNLNNFINKRNFFISGQTVFQQTSGVAIGSYHSRQTSLLAFAPHTLHKFPSLSPPTVIPFITSTSQFHSIITPSCIIKSTIAYTKSHITTTCIHISHLQHIFTGIIKRETLHYSRLSKTINDYDFIHKLFTLRLTALDYPDTLITDNSFPWLPYSAHKRCLTNKKRQNNNKPTIYYHHKYNKHKN